MIDLDLRKAAKKDKEKILRLIKESGLFIPRMRLDDFMVAYRGENLVAVAKFKTHSRPKIHELSSVGVKDGWRSSGIGTMIISKLLTKAKYDTYLNTVNPGFYEKMGFSKVEEVPAVIKKNKIWCKGCDKASCATMVKKAK